MNKKNFESVEIVICPITEDVIKTSGIQDPIVDNELPIVPFSN